MDLIIVGLFLWLSALTFWWWRTKIFDKGLDKDADKVDSQYHLQKVGLVRFNPFAETGGDQSFCLALLDGEDSGLVISSLHSRETTRIYAKPVRKGKPVGYDFSAEEKQAVLKAKKINK